MAYTQEEWALKLAERDKKLAETGKKYKVTSPVIPKSKTPGGMRSEKITVVGTTGREKSLYPKQAEVTSTTTTVAETPKMEVKDTVTVDRDAYYTRPESNQPLGTGDPEDVKTYRPFKTDLQIAEEEAQRLGLAGDIGPTTLEEQIEYSNELHRRQTQMQDAAFKLEEAQELASLTRGHAAGISSIRGAEANLYQGREGVMSSTRGALVGNIKRNITQKIEEANARYDYNNLRRAELRKQLEEAQERDNKALALEIQMAISDTEANMMQAQADLMAADDQALQTAMDLERLMMDHEELAMSKMDQNRNNLESFMGLVETGTVMTPESLIATANTLNLPFETVYGVYQGAELIRADKQLTTQEKGLKIAQLGLQLEREMRGVLNTQLQNVDYLTNLYRTGASQEEITMVKNALGISDMDDPMYRAELAYKMSEAEIKRQIAAGEVVSPLDMADLAYKYAQIGEIMGNQGGVVPVDSKYDIVPNEDGSITVSVAEGTKLGRGQCGEFVNDVFGSGVFGDSYAGKVSEINTEMPVPGAAFVQSAPGGAAKYGHVGIVESVNEDGSFNIVESNYTADDTVSRRTLTVNEVDGFVLPPDYEYIEAGPVEYTEKQKATMSLIDPNNITGTTEKLLDAEGLTLGDLGLYLQDNKKPLTEDKKIELQEIVSAIEVLKEHPGKSAAVGFGIQKLLPGFLKPGEGEFAAGTEAAGFATEFYSFLNKLTLPNLEKLKGTISDKDILFLQSASAGLNLDMSEEDFDRKLQELEDKYNEILTQGTDISEEVDGAYEMPGTNSGYVYPTT